MSKEQVWVIQTEDLEVGTILSFDLSDANGVVLHKSGTPISDRLKLRLQRNNIHSVTIRGATHFDNNEPESLLLDSFPPGSIANVQKSLADTQKSLRHLVNCFEKNEDIDVVELRAHVSDFVSTVRTDVAIALATLAIQSSIEAALIAERLAERSSKLSFLGVITSVLNGDSEEESCNIGLAGLLHDCALLLHTNWFSKNPNDWGDDFLQAYQRHPIESAEIIELAPEIAEDVIEIVSQVHEQADGSGYPDKLTLEQTSQGASILNLADAYLTLVEPIRGKKHLPSDSIAYLCYHTAQGKFSKPLLQTMLHGMSIYPVGSTVRLDDGSKAMVVQSNPGNALEPVIRMFAPGNLRIDLAESSRAIESPYWDSSMEAFERIPRSKMHEVLWRTDR